MRQLAAHYDELKTSNTEVLVIGPGEIDLAKWLSQSINAPFPILADPEGSIFDRYMLDKVLFSLIQQSAAFVIDKQSVIRYAHKVTNMMVWLNPNSVASLLNTLEKL